MRHKTILRIGNLSVSEKRSGKTAKLIRNMDFQLEQGGILGIVGESGSGKEYLPKALLGLLNRNEYNISGEALYLEQDILSMDESDLRKIRGSEIAYVFGNPRSVLNPYLTIGRQLKGLAGHYRLESVQNGVDEVLENLGIEDPKRIKKAYASQLEDELLYRIGLAMAAIPRPKILIIDEPAEDYGGMAKKGMLVLLKRIAIQYRISIIVMTKDFELARLLSDRIIVMYHGIVVEEGTVNQFIEGADHPYSAGLVRSIESAIEKDEDMYALPGGQTRFGDNTLRCPFIERCERRKYVCANEMPKLAGEGLHKVRCFNPVGGEEL
ncbi:MAG: ABC transporter ATP-binding protein [Peptostreptococcaceae bacterium]|nr:ABC transporter ATP-binding protein [Peptostreptococcaceae bacterium]